MLNNDVDSIDSRLSDNANLFRLALLMVGFQALAGGILHHQDVLLGASISLGHLIMCQYVVWYNSIIYSGVYDAWSIF